MATLSSDHAMPHGVAGYTCRGRNKGVDGRRTENLRLLKKRSFGDFFYLLHSSFSILHSSFSMVALNNNPAEVPLPNDMRNKKARWNLHTD